MSGAGSPPPATIEGWLAELGLGPAIRVERESVASWDLRLDGRRRFDVRVTVFLDPSTAAVVWAHLAPPISDSFRVSYRRLLRWNDEFPFVKFALTDDDRPVLAMEIPLDRLDRDELGLAVARVLAICDLLLEETAGWAWVGGRIPDWSGRTSRQSALFDRYAERLGELAEQR
ncbi:MAG TPA: YbjN domain-containing protein [Patescibacteria group bacterium]|nr:YbjN domain-containing protein [Patescibacteria group bacterium]